MSITFLGQDLEFLYSTNNASYYAYNISGHRVLTFVFNFNVIRIWLEFAEKQIEIAEFYENIDFFSEKEIQQFLDNHLEHITYSLNNMKNNIELLCKLKNEVDKAILFS